ncbi:toll-like receptor 13 [Anneissia japonica]|uniref:toll-like receptor 13 n=1 Tax=Anneissia japonica TaxID=1529436 RepID=UPI0014259308|nr:toll-like receptor 13 [Anneissia japonica]
MSETNGLSLWILCLILQLVLSSASTPTPCPKVVDHKYFNCSHHSLEEVPKGLPSTLEVIVLSHNRIKKLDDDSFQGLHNLVQIDVSYNSISKISTAAFNHLTKLETLILRKNQLHEAESAFLDSGWCKYELQFALSRLFKERKEVIILIFLQKIPDQLLTDQLKVHRLIRRFIKDNTYIEWPHNPDEELAFWEKLKDSLR